MGTRDTRRQDAGENRRPAQLFLAPAPNGGAPVIYDGAYSSFTDLEKVARRTTADLRPFADRFDAVVACGLSGVVVAVPVAMRLKKPLVIVRKADDVNGHHRGGEIIGGKCLSAPMKDVRWLLIDDFISSGATENYVRHRIRHLDPWAVHAGTYLYSHPGALGWTSDRPEAGPPAKPVFNWLP